MKKEFLSFKSQINNMEQRILHLKQIADHSSSTSSPFLTISTSVNTDLQT